jgi:hypothetical protein
MATELAVINFRVTPQERLTLRVRLLEEGQTVQAFFERVVKEKLLQREGRSEPFTQQDTQSDEWLAGSQAGR